MANTRGKYSREFKLEVVRLLESGEKSGPEIEKDLGIGRGQIYKWRKQYKADGIVAFPGNGNARDQELSALRKENAVLREEKEILRKAMAIFSRAKK